MDQTMFDQDLYTVAQVRALDRWMIERHRVPGIELMQRAAGAAWDVLRQRWPQARRIGVHCGPGNNGGDGYLLALCALEAGCAVQLYALAGTPHGDAATARERYEAAGGKLHEWTAGTALTDVDVHVDALYGTGLDRPPEAPADALIAAIDAHPAPVLALDVPSGINADTGATPGVAIVADATVTFIAAKRGLYTGKAPAHVGALHLATLGLPEAGDWRAIHPDTRRLAPAAMPRRAATAYKNDNGHVLAVGGDHGTAGAIRVSAEAALRTGAGLVSVATRGDNLGAINASRPELMPHAVNGPQELEGLLERASVVAIGPGLGQGAWGHALWITVLDGEQPLVLDADGLNLLAHDPRHFERPTVLTPHPGEAARLLGCDVPAVEADRFHAVRTLAQRYGAVVVLKGAGSLIAAPDGRVAVCPWGNPGMASGGMGDLLTGVVAGLLAQKLDPWHAACLAVGLHARAGDAAAADGGIGLIASDLLAPLRRLVNGLAP